MNQLIEWSPLIVFFIFFKVQDIYWATGAFMVACVLSMLIHRWRTGRFKTLHVVTAAVALVLGTATLVLHDKRFIEWKPTVILGGTALAFLVSAFIGRQPLARRMLEGVFAEPVDLTAHQWSVINLLWVAWFAILAVANIYIAHHFAEAVWVHFKVFGITLAMLLFMIPQAVWLSSKTKNAPAQGA